MSDFILFSVASLISPYSPLGEYKTINVGNCGPQKTEEATEVAN